MKPTKPAGAREHETPIGMSIFGLMLGDICLADFDLFPSLYRDRHEPTGSGASSRTLGRPATFHDVSDETLDQIAAAGFDWVWLLGVWQTGLIEREVSRTHPEWSRWYREHLPDFKRAGRLRVTVCDPGISGGSPALGDEAFGLASCSTAVRGACGSCSTSCPTTRPAITPGSSIIRNTTSRA